MDPAIEHLRNLGYSTKELHNLKPDQKIKKLARHYGFKSQRVKPNKQQARDFLQEFIALEEKNGETFSLLYQVHLARWFYPLMHKRHVDEHQITICNLPADKFYISPEWRELRYKVLDTYGNRCMACGRSPRNRVVIHVDHILPRSIYPELALIFENMQILCEDCNQGKSNKFETNWKR